MPGVSLRSSSHYYPEESGGELRKINFTVDRTCSDVYLGFNIRGGAEFGLGIFISCVTEGSIAESAGFVVGDQIIDINGTSFEGINHGEAVDYITSNSNLSVTVRATGKIPEEEQLIGKHSWIANDGERIVDGPGITDDPDHLFATEDSSYSSQPSQSQSHHDSNNSFVYKGRESPMPLGHTGYSPQMNANITNVEQRYSPVPFNYININDMDKQNIKSKGSSKKHSEKRKSSHQDSQKSKNGSKSVGKKPSKSSKKKSGSVKNKDQMQQTVTYERDHLVNQVSEKMKLLFSVNEYGMIRQSIAMYHDGECVEDLLNHILLLFTPKKYELLRDIRSLIYSDEVTRYDELVTAHRERMIEQSSLKREELVYKQNDQDVIDAPIIKAAAINVSVRSEEKPPEKAVEVVPEEKVNNEIVLHPVKSSYKSKDSSKKIKNQKSRESILKEPVVEPTPVPLPEPVVAREAVTSEPPTIKPFVPFIAEPYVLYDKDKQPVQKLVHGTRVPQNTYQTQNQADSAVEIKEKTPVADVAVTPNRVVDVAVTPNRVPVRKVVKVETTEVRTKGRKESIEIKKKTSNDNTVVTVQKTSMMPEKKNNLITLENSTFDEASNTITINATLNIESNATLNIESPTPSEDITDSIPNVPDVSGDINIVTKDVALNEEIITFEKVPPPISPKPVIPKQNYDVSVVSNIQKTREFQVDKNHQYIGLSISGGSDSRYQREIRVVSVNQNSASSIAGLQVGQILLAIDEQNLVDASHGDACQLIRTTFRDKTNNIMKIIVLENE